MLLKCNMRAIGMDSIVGIIITIRENEKHNGWLSGNLASCIQEIS